MGEDLHSRLVAIAQRYGLESVYVFGSRAHEIATMVADAEVRVFESTSCASGPMSDVDVGVQPRRNLRLNATERVGLTLELESLLGEHRVDLVILPEADALLAAEVVRGELLYTEDADAEAVAQLYYLRRAGDLAPFYRQQWRDLVGSEL